MKVTEILHKMQLRESDGYEALQVTGMDWEGRWDMYSGSHLCDNCAVDTRAQNGNTV
jgi:hypothetical protein